MLAIAPPAVIERAHDILSAVSGCRPLLSTDIAVAVGCIFVYYMDQSRSVSFVSALDASSSVHFLLALARRVRADVMRSDVAEGEVSSHL